MQVNPFAEDEVAAKTIVYERLSNEGAFAISREASQVINDFLDYVAGDFVDGITLAGAWATATRDNWQTVRGQPEFPAHGNTPVFPDIVQFMGLDRQVVETALAVYAAL